MSEHYAFSASNTVPITAELSVIELLRDWKRNGFDLYHNLNDGALHLYGDDAFEVTDPDTGDDRTEEFLEALSEYLVEQLVIQTIEYETYEGLPEAEQWVVKPSGEVTKKKLNFDPT